MILLGIDPGSERSAWVLWEWGENRVRACGYEENCEVNERLRCSALGSFICLKPEILLLEHVQHYGMAVGADVFQTVFWSGRFVEAWGGTFHRVSRRDVKLTLCGSMKAKDPNVRQALLDRFPAGKGTKDNKGPLYGISGHCWSALAVIIAWTDIQKEASPAKVAET